MITVNVANCSAGVSAIGYGLRVKQDASDCATHRAMRSARIAIPLQMNLPGLSQAGSNTFIHISTYLRVVK